MKKIILSDITLRECANSSEHSLSFKEKIEMAKLMDKLHYDSIEMPEIENTSTDTLLIKTISSLMKHSEVCVPVGYTAESVETAWNCVKGAKRSALKVSVPVSAVQMEFKCSMKPPAVIKMIGDIVTECKKYTDNIEFSAEDAVRGEKTFLYDAIYAAIKAGATKINICDSEGAMLPNEFETFIKGINDNIDGISSLTLSVEISNHLNMATACAFAAVMSGAAQIKTVAADFEYPTIENIMKVLALRGDSLNITQKVNSTELQRVVGQMRGILNSTKSNTTPFENGVGDDNESLLTLDKNADIGTVINAVKKIGYDLSAEDNANVYEAFKRVADKKDFVGTKELEAIVASSALQVPPTYKIVSYVINSGNIITATANINLTKNEESVSGVSIGDGPIDAAFLAIESIVGHHYELDDFQIRAVTEGTEAMGSSLVKLRSASGKLYSGNGISTDVIGASIRAYVSALNKIAYEEE
jgi:2-isopropylmalate synthase